jgi:hypothetical protein
VRALPFDEAPNYSSIRGQLKFAMGQFQDEMPFDRWVRENQG